MDALDLLVANELRKFRIRLNLKNQVVQARPGHTSHSAFGGSHRKRQPDQQQRYHGKYRDYRNHCLLHHNSAPIMPDDMLPATSSLFGDLPPGTMLPIPFGKRIRRS